jgi:hypothetical protein
VQGEGPFRGDRALQEAPRRPRRPRRVDAPSAPYGEFARGPPAARARISERMPDRARSSPRRRDRSSPRDRVAGPDHRSPCLLAVEQDLESGTRPRARRR